MDLSDRADGDAAVALVARRLVALDADHAAPPDLLDRVLVAGAREHRRRRALAVGTCTAAAAAVVLAVGVVAQSGDAVPADLPERPPFETVPLDPPLADVLGTPTAGVLEREGGWYDLRALGLEPDGTLSAAEQHHDRRWFDTWGRLVRVDLGTGSTTTSEAVVGDVAVRDAAATFTLEHLDPRHRDDLVCTPAVGGRRAVLTDGSVVAGSVVLTGGHVAWSMHPQETGGPTTVHVAERTATGCAARPRALPVEGTVVAAAWPDVYVRPPGGDWLVRVDGRTGRTLDLPRPERRWLLAVETAPAVDGHDRDDEVDAAAGRLVWTAGGALLVMDVTSGRVVVAADGLTAVDGHSGSAVRVCAGDRLVTWSSAPVEGDPALSRGVVHDVGTGRTAALGGEGCARGPWVVWLADDGYRFVRAP